MSVEAVNFAFAQSGLTASTKLVLLAIAYRHHHMTGVCEPTQAEICALTGLSVRSVRRAIQDIAQLDGVTATRSSRHGSPYSYEFDIAKAPEVKVTTKGKGQNKKPQTKKNPEIYDITFERFWTAYPRKVARKKCLTKWRNIKPSEREAMAVIQDVEKRKQGEWRTCEVQFIPHPHTYLNQERWRDIEPSRPEIVPDPY